MRTKLLELCVKGLQEKGLYNKQSYRDRLKQEIKAIDEHGDWDYFLNLVVKKAKFEENENHLLVAYVLGLVDSFNISEEPLFTYGDMPDIDTDYLAEVRDHLKVDWAPSVFGKENVCAIGNYTTFGIRSAMIDMARVLGKDRQQVLAVTTKLSAKDDEGKTLTLEKAIELFPEFKVYCENNPDVIEASKRLLNRNRGMGMHAGGLIVSSQRIDNLVPLVRGKDNAAVSAFVEGLHGTDLSPLGLVKFDLLVVTDLVRIYECTKLIKSKHPSVKNICALPGQHDWSDISYLNDEKCLNIANQGRLKSVFQFDSDGIRELAKSGGVTGFDDLIAYTSLFRPGPMGCGMHTSYAKRKNGLEPYEIHSVLRPVLGKTYGIMVYQEQTMQVLHVIGGIPKIHCEKIRKAISKKDPNVFKTYKPQFIDHGQAVLGWTQEKVEELWDQVVSFAEYGFNASHATAYTYISARLLWLKTHYPLEFFTSTLRCEGMGDKVKEYKIEAERNHVPVCRVDLNKSKWTFDVVDKKIYAGFSNVKGIGEDAAKEIEANQPYAGIEDFLGKYGADASVIKPLIGLGVFYKDSDDRVLLYQFCEYYKSVYKKREDRDKRNLKSRQGIVDELRYMLNDDLKNHAQSLINNWSQCVSDCEIRTAIGESVPTDELNNAVKCIKKYKKNTDGLLSKQKGDVGITFESFKKIVNDLRVSSIGTSPESVADKKTLNSMLAIDEKLKKIYTSSPTIAEAEYYGFWWDHILEYSPDFEGNRGFDQFDDDDKAICMVEVRVVEPAQKKMSKKGNPYYTVRVEDAIGRQNLITIWGEDFDRFKEEFEFWDAERESGNLLQIRLTKPEPGFRSFTFESPPRALRKQQIPAEKKNDYRLIVMRWPTKEDIEAKKGK